MMRVFAWTVLLLWLGIGFVRLQKDGYVRWRTDLSLASLSSAAERRAFRFGPEVGASLRTFEGLLDEVRAVERPTRVLIAAPQPRNVYESLAWHLLSPTTILRAQSVDLDSEARERGAEWLVSFDPEHGWRAMPVERAQ